ncbi:ArsR/SmtB family transcription factor [Streptomyces xanthii]|uniref:Helix-turn-helix domain-containing protein n=1 Tax=Streptomyces xanthii TaxID=2768069 RepID=A0A7H1B9H2_9ACTN|nr:helix-turn-helix domain-containing protein [Streptomyces xanthii]QNS05377.1 helix-turn-helix domain-containing protein [Streptomyces xanthii]
MPEQPTPPPHSSNPSEPVPGHKVRTLDARSLRGLAHPLRMHLLQSLRADGPATASQLAERLGESSGATSYHLRQLAAHGFVEDDPERGKGRERWWRAAIQGIRVDETLMTDPDPAVRGAADVYLHTVADRHTSELSTFIATRHTLSEEWIAASDMSDYTLRLTPEKSRELGERLNQVVEEYWRASQGEDDPRAEQVRLHTHLFPTDVTAEPPGEDPTP